MSLSLKIFNQNIVENLSQLKQLKNIKSITCRKIIFSLGKNMINYKLFSS